MRVTDSRAKGTKKHRFATMSNTTGAVEFTIFDLPKDSQGGLLVNLNLALISVSTVIISLRLYVRRFMINSLGLDDLISSMAYVCLTFRITP
jgi:hypothetical protein